MKTIQKKMYEAPSAEVFGIVQKRVICASEVMGKSSIKKWVEDEEPINDQVYM